MCSCFTGRAQLSEEDIAIDGEMEQFFNSDEVDLGYDINLADGRTEIEEIPSSTVPTIHSHCAE